MKMDWPSRFMPHPNSVTNLRGQTITLNEKMLAQLNKPSAQCSHHEDTAAQMILWYNIDMLYEFGC